MVRSFNIERIEDRLILYCWLLERYKNRHKEYIKNKGYYKYTFNVIDSFSLGICFYLKRRTNVIFENLPELYNHYKEYSANNGLIAPKGELPPRIEFLNEVILITKNKLKE